MAPSRTPGLLVTLLIVFSFTILWATVTDAHHNPFWCTGTRDICSRNANCEPTINVTDVNSTDTTTVASNVTDTNSTETTTSAYNVPDTNSTDVNTSYTCNCFPGYKLDSAFRCEDARECNDTLEICNKNAICDTNAMASNVTGANSTDIGSYNCTCLPGYIKDSAYRCQDGCKVNNLTCGPGAECSFRNGTFKCACKDGFSGDDTGGQLVCSIVHKCEPFKWGCGFGAACVPWNSTFKCVCRGGFRGYYEGDRLVCIMKPLPLIIAVDVLLVLITVVIIIHVCVGRNECGDRCLRRSAKQMDRQEDKMRLNKQMSEAVQWRQSRPTYHQPNFRFVRYNPYM